MHCKACNKETLGLDELCSKCLKIALMAAGDRYEMIDEEYYLGEGLVEEEEEWEDD